MTFAILKGWGVGSSAASAAVAAIRVTDSITLGSLIIVVAGGIAAAYFGSKQKAQRNEIITALNLAQSSATAWREEHAAEKEKTARLELAAQTAATDRADLQQQLADARAKTDITRVEKMIDSAYREAIAERDLQHKERLAIIQQIGEQSTHTVDVLVGVHDALTALTVAVQNLTKEQKP